MFLQKEIYRSLAAEFVGTFILIVFGVGFGLHFDPKGSDGKSLEEIAFGWGLLVYCLAEVFMHISGCHVNPLLTIPFVIFGKIEAVKGLLYLVSQITGALLGIGLLKVLMPQKIEGGLLCTIPPYLSPIQTFGQVFLYSFLLFLFVHAVTDEGIEIKGSLPLNFGFTLIGLILSGGRWGLQLNPARCLAPSIIENHWDNHWLFWIAPLGGAISGSFLYLKVFKIASVKINPYDSTFDERKMMDFEEDEMRNIKMRKKEKEIHSISNGLDKQPEGIIHL